jgi:[ribosomal protein S5]-alanine N-acetyltransferase
MSMPVLNTERLTIRPLEASDLDVINTVLNEAFGGSTSLETRKQWLDWTMLGYEVQAQLNQPPYGERAIVLKKTNELIGALGLVQSYEPFEKLPFFASRLKASITNKSTPQIGLFWGIHPKHQKQGYAVEAAQALINFMFETMRLHYIVATTEYDNQASIRTMQRLGMTIEHNPDPTPEWFQVVGILENK